MNDFTFHRPSSVMEAVGLLRSAEEGKLLSGGQSYLPILKEGLAAPSDLISLRNVGALQGIRDEGGSIIIGAGQTHASVCDSAVVQNSIPGAGRARGRHRRRPGPQPRYHRRLPRPRRSGRRLSRLRCSRWMASIHTNRAGRFPLRVVLHGAVLAPCLRPSRRSSRRCPSQVPQQAPATRSSPIRRRSTR